MIIKKAATLLRIGYVILFTPAVKELNEITSEYEKKAKTIGEVISAAIDWRDKKRAGASCLVIEESRLIVALDELEERFELQKDISL